MALLAIFARKYPYFSTGKFKKTAFGNSPIIQELINICELRNSTNVVIARAIRA